MVRFVKNGKENGKTAYLVRTPSPLGHLTFASIVFDGQDWVVRRQSGRIDRFGKLSEAKNEAMKG